MIGVITKKYIIIVIKITVIISKINIKLLVIKLICYI